MTRHRAAPPVTIRSVTCPARQVAADALGVSKSAVAIAARRGTLDSVGLLHDGRGFAVPCLTVMPEGFRVSREGRPTVNGEAA